MVAGECGATPRQPGERIRRVTLGELMARVPQAALARGANQGPSIGQHEIGLGGPLPRALERARHEAVPAALRVEQLAAGEAAPSSASCDVGLCQLRGRSSHPSDDPTGMIDPSGTVGTDLLHGVVPWLLRPHACCPRAAGTGLLQRHRVLPPQANAGGRFALRLGLEETSAGLVRDRTKAGLIVLGHVCTGRLLATFTGSHVQRQGVLSIRWAAITRSAVVASAPAGGHVARIAGDGESSPMRRGIIWPWH